MWVCTRYITTTITYCTSEITKIECLNNKQIRMNVNWIITYNIHDTYLAKSSVSTVQSISSLCIGSPACVRPFFGHLHMVVFFFGQCCQQDIPTASRCWQEAVDLLGYSKKTDSICAYFRGWLANQVQWMCSTRNPGNKTIHIFQLCLHTVVFPWHIARIVIWLPSTVLNIDTFGLQKLQQIIGQLFTSVTGNVQESEKSLNWSSRQNISKM